jgi:hypothetical protein
MSDFSEDEAQDMELWVFSSLVFFFFYTWKNVVV